MLTKSANLPGIRHRVESVLFDKKDPSKIYVGENRFGLVFAGGGLEKNEKSDRMGAASREVEEEFGLRAKLMDFGHKPKIDRWGASASQEIKPGRKSDGAKTFFFSGTVTGKALDRFGADGDAMKYNKRPVSEVVQHFKDRVADPNNKFVECDRTRLNALQKAIEFQKSKTASASRALSPGVSAYLSLYYSQPITEGMVKEAVFGKAVAYGLQLGRKALQGAATLGHSAIGTLQSMSTGIPMPGRQLVQTAISNVGDDVMANAAMSGEYFRNGASRLLQQTKNVYSTATDPVKMYGVLDSLKSTLVDKGTKAVFNAQTGGALSPRLEIMRGDALLGLAKGVSLAQRGLYSVVNIASKGIRNSVVDPSSALPNLIPSAVRVVAGDRGALPELVAAGAARAGGILTSALGSIHRGIDTIIDGGMKFSYLVSPTTGQYLNYSQEKEANIRDSLRGAWEGIKSVVSKPLATETATGATSAVKDLATKAWKGTSATAKFTKDLAVDPAAAATSINSMGREMANRGREKQIKAVRSLLKQVSQRGKLAPEEVITSSTGGNIQRAVGEIVEDSGVPAVFGGMANAADAANLSRSSAINQAFPLGSAFDALAQGQPGVAATIAVPNIVAKWGDRVVDWSRKLWRVTDPIGSVTRRTQRAYDALMNDPEFRAQMTQLYKTRGFGPVATRQPGIYGQGMFKPDPTRLRDAIKVDDPTKYTGLFPKNTGFDADELNIIRNYMASGRMSTPEVKQYLRQLTRNAKGSASARNMRPFTLPKPEPKE